MKVDFRRFVNRALSYLNESKGFVFASFFIFVLSAILGFIFVERLSFFDALLKGIFAQVEGLSGFRLIAFIFYNNVTSAFFGLFFGFFLGIFSFFNIMLNGALVGYVLARTSETQGFGLVWRLVPHGIFELPAIFIATGLGMRLGATFFSHKWKKILKGRVLDSARVFLVVIVPLLIVAAVIEGLLITFSG